MPTIAGVPILDLAQTFCLAALLLLAFIQHMRLDSIANEITRIKRVQLHFDNQLKSLERNQRG